MHERKVGLTPEEVVEAYPTLTKSTGTLANWRHLCRGPKYYRVGGRRIVYRPEDIESFMFSKPTLTQDARE